MYLARSPIHSHIEVMGGTLVFRTTRVPAQILLDNLRDGYSLNDFLAMFPSVEREDAEQFWELACGHQHPMDDEGTITVGSLDRLAFRIFPSEPDTGGQVRLVDIVVDGTVLPRRDNWVYVPHFASTLQCTSQLLKSTINWARYDREFGERNVTECHEFLRLDCNYKLARFHAFMEWGESTDDVYSFLIPHMNRLYLTYQTAVESTCGDHREYSVVNGIEVRPFDLICVLDEAAEFLHRGLRPPGIESSDRGAN
jgi:uncharacterized protein (DUF433 family)